MTVGWEAMYMERILSFNSSHMIMQFVKTMPASNQNHTIAMIDERSPRQGRM